MKKLLYLLAAFIIALMFAYLAVAADLTAHDMATDLRIKAVKAALQDGDTMAKLELAHLLPNPKLTPGVARTDITQTQICSTKWGKDERLVTAAMKRQVFQAYDFTGNTDPACTPDKNGRRCEVDHLISRELGGADDVRNLWPEPYGGPWNASMKDRLENKLHKLVCTGKLPLSQAQREIATNWIKAYQEYVK